MNASAGQIRGLVLCVLVASSALAALPPAHAGNDPVVAIQQHTFVTTDTAADACDRADETLITVAEDTVVQYCFRVRNVGTVPLTAHDLVTDSFGTLDSMRPLTLAPGESAWRSHLDVAADDHTTTATWIARDVFPVYTPSATAYDFTDISASGQPIAVAVYFASPVTLPFPVRLYGKASRQLSICNLGVIEFDSTRGICAQVPAALPVGNQPLSLMPYWDDLGWQMGGVWYRSVGTAPHRRTIVQWQRDHSNFPGDGNGITFQAVLYEDSDRIVFQYKDVSFGIPGADAGATASIGINYDGNLGQSYSFQNASLTDQQAIAWTPNVWRTTQASSSATVIVHAARISLGARPVQSVQAPGHVVQRQVAIASTGQLPLTWNLGEAQANSTAHIPAHGRAHTSVPGASQDPTARELARMLAISQGASAAGPPVAYGRDNTSEQFVRIDLADGSYTPIASVQDAPISGVDFRDADFSRLYSLTGGLGSQFLMTVDPSTGGSSYVGTSNPGAGEAWSGVSADSSNGVLYGSSVDFFSDHNGVSFCGPDSMLYRVNPNAATPRLIGRILANTCIRGIATNANGELYGVDTENDTLVAIDKVSGAGTVVGALGFDANYDVGLDFDEAANVLYLGAWNRGSLASELRTVNTATGATTLVAPFHLDGVDQPDIMSLALASGGGGCVDPADVPWLSAAPASGTLAPGAGDVLTLRLDSTGLAAGSYSALLCVFSNDPRRRFVTLPVRLDVDPDAIFADAFD
jgi:hypothetical protein